MFKKTIYIVIAVIASVALSNSPTYAIDSLRDTDGTFEITPSGTDIKPKLVLKSGELYKNSFQLKNLSDTKMTYKITIKPITFSETHIDTINKTSENEIIEWTSIFNNLDTITLEPQDSKTIDYMIDVPTNVLRGSQNEIIDITPVSPNEFGRINSVSYAIYVDIDLSEESKSNDNMENYNNVLIFCAIIAIIVIGLAVIAFLRLQNNRNNN